jgi:8-oxo-dGTP pyrophosphatase MutT (NUDIX family)
MAQIYRIYVNEAALIITENLHGQSGDFQLIDKQGFDFPDFYNRLKNERSSASFVLVTENPKELFKEIKKQLVLIGAAGGLVKNEENKYLFIFRRGKWDLPKGKIDEGEETQEAAVREVEEECGIKIDEVLGKALNTYHVYEQDGDLILKKTSWYKMRAENQGNLVPQLEEDITEARWLSPADFEMVKQNTFPLILDVMDLIED